MTVPEFLDVAAAKTQHTSLERPPRVDIMAHIVAARRAGASPSTLGRQLLEVIRGPGRLTVGEYFYYRLYEQEIGHEERVRFIGKRRQNAFHYKCNDARWFAVCHDKALFYLTMRGADLPIPQTRMLYEKSCRELPAPNLRTEAALNEYLSNPASYPLFAKPISGMFSIGALSLSGIEEGKVVFRTREKVQTEELVRFISAYDDGFLFQERLEPESALQKSFGHTLPSVRFLVLLAPEGPSIESVVVKIPAGDNSADNYWREGNILGAVDSEGTIYRAVTGTGMNMRAVAEHPDTAAPIIGMKLPNWVAAKDLCLQAAGAFPGIRTQSWDIALAQNGPVVLELNFGGDLNLHQLAHRRGALTPTFIEHLKRCGVRVSGPKT